MKRKRFMVSTWTRRDSNPRSLRCERSAFPAKLRAHLTKKSQKNGGNGARTHDLSRVRRTLSRLSYVSMTSILPHFSNLTRGKFAKTKKTVKRTEYLTEAFKRPSAICIHIWPGGRRELPVLLFHLFCEAGINQVFIRNPFFQFPGFLQNILK